MKKSFLLYPVIVLMAIVAILYTSCKKPHHDLAPTPNNIRLLGYTATTWRNADILLSVADTINESYTFFYNPDNTVSRILYTTNDTTKIRLGTNALNAVFDYATGSGSTGNGYVIKTTTNLGGISGPTIFEVDTIYLNKFLITKILMPGRIDVYNYGFNYTSKLLTGETNTYYNDYHGRTSVNVDRIYNSDNGDFLDYASDRILHVTFPSTMSISPYAMRDYWVKTPLLPFEQAVLNYVNTPDLNYTVHDNLASYTDQLTFTSSGIPLIIFAKDTANDSCYVAYPGTIWPKQTYTYYTNLPDRIGDYLQLTSFTKWGFNLYQTTNMVQSMSNSGYKTNVTYNIDAYNKVTQMTAKVIDSLSNTRTTTYNLQYEIF